MEDKSTPQSQLLRELEQMSRRMATLEASEAEHRRVAEALRLNEARLQTLMQLNQLTGASMQKITDFALEAAVALTSSKIGYLAFVNEDETVLTMHSWSKSAMHQCAIQDKPIVYPLVETGLWGEALRQRQPIVTNDYPAPSPLKKGYPEGHVAMLRHMNAPIFDGERIVIVAGVGNKDAPYDESDVRQLTLLMHGMWQLIEHKRKEEALHTQKHTAELARAEAEADYERHLVHSLMDHIPDSIYFKDLEGRFIRINKAKAARSGLRDPAEAMGKTDFDFFPLEHAQAAAADEQQIMRSGQPVLGKEEHLVWPDGHETWVSSSKLPLYDQAGRIAGTLGLSRDITEQKEAAEALRRAKETAEAANRAKGAFLANMSHEIRTPLNAIIGMTELVLKSPVTAQQREFLMTVRDSGEALLSVINDILDFSKIEAGKLALDRDVFDLRESLGDTMKSFAIRAHQQGLELVYHIRADVPRMVVGDYNRLRQIVVNLVGNAIKFTDQGEVLLEVGVESVCGDDIVLHFVVSDTGIGVPEEKRTAIFEMFEQADSSMARRHGGTGLGLAIASRLVDLMGGRIWVESEIGKGTRFHFIARLNVAKPEAFEAVPAEPPSLHGMPVLVVDDNATNRRILEETLRSWMMFPILARNAREALEMLRQSQRTAAPCRLVITDGHMPDVDGFALAVQIKRDAEMGSTVVMMLTSGDRPEDTARCEELGIAAYLLKPIKQSELLEAIQFALGITVKRMDSRRHEGRQSSRVGRLRILLAEDSLVNQKLAVALLQTEGHAVTVANNGKEALAELEAGDFDLILMDVQMPEMDGLEATARIRAAERPTGRHIPIVAMTAHALKGDQQRCLETGMDAYVSKPIRPDALFDAIEASIAAGGGPARSPAALPGRGAADWSEALRVVRGDRRLLRVLVEAAAEEIPRITAAIREAVAAGDAANLQLAAHTLKGAIRYFASGQAFEQVRRLENMGRDKNLEEAQQSLAALEAEVRLLTPLLADHLRQGS